LGVLVVLALGTFVHLFSASGAIEAAATANAEVAVDGVDNNEFGIGPDNIGTRVAVEGLGDGYLRYFGKHRNKGNVVAGVELDLKVGNMNGSRGMHEYFKCEEKHGVLADPKDVSIVPESYGSEGAAVEAMPAELPFEAHVDLYVGGESDAVGEPTYTELPVAGSEETMYAESPAAGSEETMNAESPAAYREETMCADLPSGGEVRPSRSAEKLNNEAPPTYQELIRAAVPNDFDNVYFDVSPAQLNPSGESAV
jgi:hypothetical protein